MKKLILGMLLFGSMNAIASEVYTCDQYEIQTGNQIFSDASYAVDVLDQNNAQVVFQTFAPHYGPSIVSILTADKSEESILRSTDDKMDQAQMGPWLFAKTTNKKAGLLTNKNNSFIVSDPTRLFVS